MSGSSDAPLKKVKGNKKEAIWLMSFSDMCLTLICFFLLLVSTMKPAKNQFENIKDGMRSTEQQEKGLKKVSARLNKVIKEQNLEKTAQISYDADGLRVEFNDGILFESGSASARESTRRTVAQVMKVIASMADDYHMVIEGHTDDVPLKDTTVYRSNWELSSGRGFALMRAFHKLGVQENKISVLAFAHTRPKVPYEGLKGEQLERARQANRRVVVRIE